MKRILLVLSLLFMSISASANIVVIAHKGVIEKLDKREVQRIFTGKEHTFEDGDRMTLLTPKSNSEEVRQFNNIVLGKSNSQYKSLCAKLMFTGKVSPPIEMLSDNDIVKRVLKDKTAIAYVNSENVNLDGVFVVYIVGMD